MLSVLTSLNHVVLYKTLPPCGKALSSATCGSFRNWAAEQLLPPLRFFLLLDKPKQAVDRQVGQHVDKEGDHIGNPQSVCILKDRIRE